jgi:carbamoyl-phosphate synthase small subunit
MHSTNLQGKLVLEDGSVFYGKSFGFNQSVSGEVVFATGMVGYNESLTDPSYLGQVLTLTYPLIGNYGVPEEKKENGLAENFESDSIKVKALIVSNYSTRYSHWDAKRSLGEWLQQERIPALSGIDTRALTKKLREKGVMLGKIIIEEQEIDFYDPNKENLAALASQKQPQLFKAKQESRTVALLDCGAKNSIIHSLLKRGVSVYRVPWDYDLFSSGQEFDGILVSNGPGDPKQCVKTIDTLKQALAESVPTFGICYGNQLMALAGGADTFKLKYGHRGQNQPALEVDSKKCFITSQNHGFAVEKNSLKGLNLEASFLNANDDSVEGIAHKSKPFFAVQWHPEASPGPTDTQFLFDKFLGLMKR